MDKNYKQNSLLDELGYAYKLNMYDVSTIFLYHVLLETLGTIQRLGLLLYYFGYIWKSETQEKILVLT